MEVKYDGQNNNNKQTKTKQQQTNKNHQQQQKHFFLLTKNLGTKKRFVQHCKITVAYTGIKHLDRYCSHNYSKNVFGYEMKSKLLLPKKVFLKCYSKRLLGLLMEFRLTFLRTFISCYKVNMNVLDF